MRFVQVKSAEQRGRLMLHRTRDLLMRQRTQLINALQAHLAELGIVAAQGNAGLKELLKIIAGEREKSPRDDWLDEQLDSAPPGQIVGGARSHPTFNRTARHVQKAATLTKSES